MRGKSASGHARLGNRGSDRGSGKIHHTGHGYILRRGSPMHAGLSSDVRCKPPLVTSATSIDTAVRTIRILQRIILSFGLRCFF